jgi:hypothetical protein
MIVLLINPVPLTLIIMSGHKICNPPKILLAGVRVLLHASCFSFIKKPKEKFSLNLCLVNQSVIAGVRIFDTSAASLRAVFH